MLEYVVPIFRGEIGAVQLDAQLVRYRLRIGIVFLRGAIFSAVILLPILHEQALYPVTLLQEQKG